MSKPNRDSVTNLVFAKLERERDEARAEVRRLKRALRELERLLDKTGQSMWADIARAALSPRPRATKNDPCPNDCGHAVSEHVASIGGCGRCDCTWKRTTNRAAKAQRRK